MDNQDVVKNIISILEDKKAEDIYYADLSHRNTIAEQLVIATAKSKRQVYALHNYVEKFFKEVGIKPHSEGTQQSEWVLVFGHNIAVHIFTPETRDFYNLEEIWGK